MVRAKTIGCLVAGAMVCVIGCEAKMAREAGGMLQCRSG